MSAMDFNGPHPLEIDKISFDFNSRYCIPQVLGCTPQFHLVVTRFLAGIAVETGSQPSISATIRMHHKDDEGGSVKADRFTNLLQNRSET
jgi:hypothetical protein